MEVPVAATVDAGTSSHPSGERVMSRRPIGWHESRPHRMKPARIAGWGTALPEEVVTNADLAAMLDASDEWIRQRSGILERRIGGTTSGLAIEAGQAALDHAGMSPEDIELLVLCTSTPDQQIPASASTVQHTLGLRCGAFDLNAACSGFVYGLVTAYQFVAAGGTQRVLLIGSETMSRMVGWNERTTAVLFGDGAGALVLDAAEGEPSLLGWDLGSDGSLRSILDADIGGFMRMNGKEVFRCAVRVLIEVRYTHDEPGRNHRRRHRTFRSPPGQHPHHRVGECQTRVLHGPDSRRTRPHRQHVRGLDSDLSRPCRREWPTECRRSRAHGRIRRRNGVVDRNRAVVAVSDARLPVHGGFATGS